MGSWKEPRTLHEAQELLHDHRYSPLAEHARLSDLLWASFGKLGVHLEHLCLLEEVLDWLRAQWAETRAARDPFEPRFYSTLEREIECLPELFFPAELRLARWAQDLAAGELPPSQVGPEATRDNARRSPFSISLAS